MKIIIIGASGVIGRGLTAAFSEKNEVVTAGSNSGDLRVDIGCATSIRAFYEKAGSFDALICAAGPAHLDKIQDLEGKHFRIGFEKKLMGQINLVIIGQHFINKGGIFTLTSGIVAEEPIPFGVAVTTTDSAINAFVKAASRELWNDIRINAVAPSVLADTPSLHSFFPGHQPVSMDDVVRAYTKSLFGIYNGEVIRAY